MLNYIAVAIIAIFSLEGFYALQEIHPNRAAAAMAALVLIGIVKLLKLTRR